MNVIIVRAVVLNAAAPRTSDPARRETMQQAAVAGFEKALALQTPYLDQLSEHARGELLGGLAEGWSRLGDYRQGPQAGPMTCLTCHRQ